MRDGTELLYEKRGGMSDEVIAKMVKPKEELAVFSPTAMLRMRVRYV